MTQVSRSSLPAECSFPGPAVGPTSQPLTAPWTGGAGISPTGGGLSPFRGKLGIWGQPGGGPPAECPPVVDEEQWPGPGPRSFRPELFEQPFSYQPGCWNATPMLRGSLRVCNVRRRPQTCSPRAGGGRLGHRRTFENLAAHQRREQPWGSEPCAFSVASSLLPGWDPDLDLGGRLL